MWICRRKKGLIREILGTGRNSPEEENLAQEEALLYSLQKKTLISLLKAIQNEDEDGCILHLSTSGGGGGGGSTPETPQSFLQTLKRMSGEENSGGTLKALCPIKEGRICLHPRHWNWVLRQKDPPSLPLERLKSKEETSEDDIQESFSTCGTLRLLNGGQTADEQGVFPWCKLAYWEESHRVGPMFPVYDSSLDVFSEFLKGSGLSLSGLFTQNTNPSTSTREVRKKIGRGLSLSQESSGLWIHNRGSNAIFVNSPTLDLQPLTGVFIVYKVPPGHSVLAFNYDIYSGPLSHFRALRDSGPRSDERSVRVSFAKGWGTNYKRPNVTNCPCWLEIML
eukprot:TRINITY_DN828_c1_g1_i1.p1 TRINITY_DN828_c1_g1~~TRINITY_DN828_c1_g1_i1.p1  ORF type:complete len:337 (-),score=93.45 TRINITY_DN828_c1_g1_i1:376-1386(-)